MTFISKFLIKITICGIIIAAWYWDKKWYTLFEYQMTWTGVARILNRVCVTSSAANYWWLEEHTNRVHAFVLPVVCHAPFLADLVGVCLWQDLPKQHFTQQGSQCH